MESMYQCYADVDRDCCSLWGSKGMDMTFQIGLVGSDGLIIASDETAVREGGLRADGKCSMRVSSGVEKIFVAKKNNLICAFAGDSIVTNFASELIQSVSSGDDLSEDLALKNRATEVYEAHHSVEIRKRTSGQMMVAIPGVLKLWEFLFMGGEVILQAVSNRSFCGDRCNPAVYFAERYLPLDSLKYPVERLKLIAAHTILEGSALNPTSVGGLSILICMTGEQPRFLEPDELQELRTHSQKLHDMIAVTLLPAVGPLFPK